MIHLNPSQAKVIKVLIVDDSSLFRKLLTKILSQAPGFEIVGAASDPFAARDLIIKHQPDVITLDIEMPKMDGLTFLKKLMQHYPVRTIIISSLAKKNSEIALEALEAGAIHILEKPNGNLENSLSQFSSDLIQSLKEVSQAKFINHRRPLHRPKLEVKTNSFQGHSRASHQILAIASSTGGTQALQFLLSQLPGNIPGTVIVQHMPPGYTKAYAEALQKICPFEVKEAEEGDAVIPGRALIAPGNYHMEIVRSGIKYLIKLHQMPYLNGVRPAADYLMNSVATYAAPHALGVVLTGMGKDATDGLLAMKTAGCFTIAQNEETCVVYGMPKAAIEAGAIDSILPLEKISELIIHKMKLKPT